MHPACAEASPRPADPTTLPALAAELAQIAARQAALAHPDALLWATIPAEERAALNSEAHGLACRFRRLHRAAATLPCDTAADLRAVARVWLADAPDDPLGEALARGVVRILAAPAAEPATLMDLIATAHRLAGDALALGARAPGMEVIVARTALHVAAGIIDGRRAP